MVQVGHNVRMGRGCRIAALVGIGGSSEFGDGVVIGGVAGVKDHVHLGTGSMVGAMSAVWKDVPAGVVVSGQPARPHREQLRTQAAAARLADADERLRVLERRLKEVEARQGIE
jgi:UDP-3-O-[3-hydroxymyristoyl] glucosamine N-acyltransferase